MKLGIWECVIGALAALGMVVGGLPAWAGSPASLYIFQGGADGNQPGRNLVANPAGNLYGVTEGGGVSNNGVVFELSPPVTQSGSWKQSVIYSFTGGTDGRLPQAGLVLDPAGNLYGTTSGGGCLPNCNGFGYGTVFKLTPPAGGSGSWAFTTIYRFQPKFGVQDGAGPEAPLTLDASGNLYGTTYTGGVHVNGYGVVFKLTPPSSGSGSWTETLLHVFSGYGEAAFPFAGVTLDNAGNLYGTTSRGGFSGTCCGVVFEVSPPAGGFGPWTTTILHRFMGPDGKYPFAGVVIDASGNLFGVTEFGAGYDSICSQGCGAAFELAAPSGGSGPAELTIYRFGASSSVLPSAILLQNGILYGVAQGGSQGTLFALSPSGKKFWNNVTVALAGNVGEGPESLITDPPVSGASTFYGVTNTQGLNENCCGTVFNWTP